jgi:AcrR family transcriptional regulator
MAERSTTRTGARERRRRETTEAIQAAALRLFGERGFEETTVEDVAAAAGVSRATVFRYFGSKDDIVFGVEPALLETLRELIRRRPHSPLDEVLVTYAAHVDAAVPDLHARGAVVATTPRLVERFAHLRWRWEGAVAEELAARRGRRAAVRLDDEVMAGIAMAVLFVAFRRWAAEPRTPLARHARAAVAAAGGCVARHDLRVEGARRPQAP